MEPTENKGKVSPLAIIAGVLVLGGIGAYVVMDKNEEPTDSPEESGANTNTNNTNSQNPVTPGGTGGATPAPTPTPQTNDYKDGTYSATGNYVSPGGAEQVGVKLTLKNDIITDITFTPMAERPMSVQMQTNFSGGYKPLVLGKDIDAVTVTKVSGSSLTPKGFTDALNKIKAEARTTIQAS